MEAISRHRKPTPVGLYGAAYNDGINAAIQEIMLAPTLAQPNDPLTLDELRQMDGQPVYVVSAIGERSSWYIVDIEENELKNPWDRISLESWDEGYPYTAYRRPPEMVPRSEAANETD